MSIKIKLKKGDDVIVLAGKDKGKTGKIESFVTKKNRVIVKDINLVKDTKKARSAEEKSQIVKREASLHISNISYYIEKEKKPSKLGYKFEENKKVRFVKKENKVSNG